LTESQIQMQIVQALQAMGVMFFSVPNEALGKINHRGDRNRMMRLKSMGLLSGVSDLVVVLKNKIVFLEVKTAKGRQSKSQKDFEHRVTLLGHEYHVVRSVDDVISIVDSTGRVR